MANSKEMTPTTTTSSSSDRLVFVNWDHRPAILVDGKAFAVLKPGGPWVEVDEPDVGHTSGVLSEARWRRHFRREGYGALDVWRWRDFRQDNEPQLRPPPRAADFDNAVRACVAAHRAHQATASLPELPDDETPPTAPP